MKDLLDRLSPLTDVERYKDFMFFAIKGAQVEDPEVLEALTTLFMDIHQGSGGVWPVLRSEKSTLREKVCDWVRQRYLGADVAALILYAPDGTPVEVVGAGGLKSLNRDSDADLDYWNGGVVQAIQSRDDERSTQLAFLNHSGLPLEVHKKDLSGGGWLINPDKTAILQSGGISPRWRRKGLGRYLLHFRKKISHQLLQKTVLFNVIADTVATTPAIALYEKERALFLGNHFDGQQLPRYNMQLYAFPLK